MEDLNTGDLLIKIDETEDKVVMSWLGKSRERDPGLLLNPYLSDMIEELEGSTLTMDFINFEYMNSSTVSPIIKFFQLLEKGNIPTKVLYNSHSSWQCASFKALEVISRSYKNVEVQGMP